MKLELWRDKPNACTLGNMYINGTWQCFTLELPKPIPAGEYPVKMVFWKKRNGLYPLLQDVPGHTGIFIHAGNNVSVTKGCILVGLRKGDNFILDSLKALNILKARIPDAPEAVTIKIFDPCSPHLAVVSTPLRMTN